MKVRAIIIGFICVLHGSLSLSESRDSEFQSTERIARSVDPRCVETQAALPRLMPFEHRTLRLQDGEKVEYHLFAPVEPAGTKKMPLILIFHHGGIRGRYEYLLYPQPPGHPYGIGYFLTESRRKRFPAYLFIPSAGDDIWTDSRVDKAVGAAKKVAETLPVDYSRIYAVGQSMGAEGVWNAVSRYPEFFAAGIAVGTVPNDPQFGTRHEPPVFAIMGDSSEHGYSEDSRQNVQRARNHGASIRYREYIGADHEEMTQLAFCDDDLALWLFNNEKH